MTRVFSTLVVCLTLASGWSPAEALQEAQTMTWKGALDAGGQQLRLEVEISTDGEGRHTGRLRSIDQGNATLELSEITLDGETFAFAVSQIGAEFDGVLSQDGTEAKGAFRQGGVELPLTLIKTGGDEDVAPSARETLLEAWVGKIQMGPVEPVMQFRIVTLESGETAAYFDSVTEGRTGFKAQWSIEGDTLRFEVPSILLSYTGTLNEARDKAEGTWSQGGRSFPLTLTKQPNE